MPRASDTFACAAARRGRKPDTGRRAAEQLQQPYPFITAPAQLFIAQLAREKRIDHRHINELGPQANVRDIGNPKLIGSGQLYPRGQVRLHLEPVARIEPDHPTPSQGQQASSTALACGSLAFPSAAALRRSGDSRNVGDIPSQFLESARNSAAAPQRSPAAGPPWGVWSEKCSLPEQNPDRPRRPLFNRVLG